MAGRNTLIFERSHGLIIVNSFLVGKKGLIKSYMALDTGASLTLISPELANLLKFDESDCFSKMTISSPIGQKKGYKIILPKFEVCQQAIDNLEVGVIKLHDKHKIDGLIGLNFLENFNLNINFKDLTITLNSFKS